MGPKTVHEQMAQSGREEGEDGDKKEDDELKAMFGDLKKKKKKKDIPLDLVRFAGTCDFTHNLKYFLVARGGLRDINASSWRCR